MKDCVSFELARRLKEAGVAFPTHGWYHQYTDSHLFFFDVERSYHRNKTGQVSAPTFTELWEKMPESIFVPDCILSGNYGKSTKRVFKLIGHKVCGCSMWMYQEDGRNGSSQSLCDDDKPTYSPADSIARLLLYCLSNRFLTPDQINGEKGE